MTDKNPHQMTLEEALAPLMLTGIKFRSARMLLHEMFTSAVINAPENEIDNFTAKKMTPLYLALCETLENLEILEN